MRRSRQVSAPTRPVIDLPVTGSARTGYTAHGYQNTEDRLRPARGIGRWGGHAPGLDPRGAARHLWGTVDWPLSPG